MNFPQKHHSNTKRLLKAIDRKKISDWFLEIGYFPEQYVLPPSFKTQNFKLKSKPNFNNLKKLSREKLINISYPKTTLSLREFAIMHPFNYHDIIFWMNKKWDLIINHIFNKNNKIYSYSLPIPINAKSIGHLSNLRGGRMIYEWLEMAEKDIIAEANDYKYLIRADISNFYNSIYTHSIAWALHGRENAFQDRAKFKLVGCKIDKIIQYANDIKTIGIPVGSALCDFISEILLATIDLNISNLLRKDKINFLGTRFKDDYRFLCNSREDGKKILKVLYDSLKDYNLLLNENKTQTLKLPEGLFRKHITEYHSISLKMDKIINFTKFQQTLILVLEIHRKFPGTSILDKFLAELFDDNNTLKLRFTYKTKYKEVKTTISLLLLLNRESEKTFCYVLAIIEQLYNMNKKNVPIKYSIIEILKFEVKKANKEKSIFKLVWLVYLFRALSIQYPFSKFINPQLRENGFLKSLISRKQFIFENSGVILFENPKQCNVTLAKYLDIFDKS